VPGATLEITSPSVGAAVSGTVAVETTLFGLDVQAYNLRIDSAGLDYAWHPQAGMRTYYLDTSNLAAGRHVLLATMVDAAGRKSTATTPIIVG